MARKVCPQCKLVTGASSATCSRCGHVFAPTEVPQARRAQRCVMCGIVNASSASKCDCVFLFDQAPEDLRAFYLARRSVAWVLMIGSIVLAIGGCALLVVMVAFSRVIPIKATV